ncbi:MAG: hypothetical protein KDB07_08570 [Planctomycetes bacterium]|nr:hypothetical protein [Planctomycetota bacterium]
MESLGQRWGQHRVFNLEVDLDHTYYVTRQRVLTHNSYSEARKKMLAANVEVGRKGEELAGWTKNIKQIDSLSGKRNFRVPDFMDERVIGEVKNVKRQGWTHQIQDFVRFAEQEGKRFVLKVPRGTKLSSRLQKQIDAKRVKLSFLD